MRPFPGIQAIDRALARAARLRPERLAHVLIWGALQSPEWWRRELGIELDDDERAGLVALAAELRRRGQRP